MKDEIRIRLSLGLIAVAVVHAILLGVVLTAASHAPNTQPCDHNACHDEWLVPRSPEAKPAVGDIEKLPEPPRVNYAAQGELKQQAPCYPNRVVVYPSVNSGTVVNTTAASNASKPTTTAPATDLKPPVAAPASPPPKKSFQIALFVGNDTRSRQLQTWFAEDTNLVKLRKGCEFQVYTAENVIYKTRFANLVPVEQFPVVLFQDSTGGHVHAAGRTMIPSTPGELFSDLKQGYELYQQAKRAQKTGAVKTEGYSWDEAISPTLYLSADDCPDGYCPVEPVDTWRPGDRLRDGLFDRDDNSRNALFWMSAGEMATVALFIVAAVLLGFILIKRGM